MTRPSGPRPSSVASTLGLPPPGSHVEHVAQPVRSRLVRTEEQEVRRPIGDDHVAQERSEHPGRLPVTSPQASSLRRRTGGNRAAEVAQQQAAVCVRIRTHSALAFGGDGGELRDAGGPHRRRTHPADSCAATPRAHAGDPGSSRTSVKRYLMRTPGALRSEPVDLVRARSIPSACAARSSARSDGPVHRRCVALR